MNDDSRSQFDVAGARSGKRKDVGSPTTGRSAGSSDEADKQSNLGGGPEQNQNVTDSVKEFASHAGEKLLDAAETEKKAGADFVGGLAGAVRRAAKEFEGDVPQAATYIRTAADQIDSVAHAFRQRDVNQLIADVQDFARRQPTAFLGATFLAGFVAVRFLKSSTGGASRHTSSAANNSARAPGEFS